MPGPSGTEKYVPVPDERAPSLDTPEFGEGAAAQAWRGERQEFHNSIYISFVGIIIMVPFLV